MGKRIQVTRTYLQMTQPKQLRRFVVSDPSLALEPVARPTVALAQRLYHEVGAHYHWVDRDQWSPAEWERYVGAPGFELHLLKQGGETAGFFELTRDADGAVEIALFGLLPRFLGQGLGKHLLTLATERAWASGAGRVWLHTCTLDHPAALPNYLKRGFEIYKTESYETEIGG